nr:hypothetical protein Q903MT_gene2389 [Picea sitchensis]
MLGSLYALLLRSLFVAMMLSICCGALCLYMLIFVVMLIIRSYANSAMALVVNMAK